MRTVRRARVDEIHERRRRRPPVDPTAPTRLRAEQQLGPAIVVAGVVAVASAWAWALLAAASGFAFAGIALGVGAVCGWAVQRVGRGVDAVFSVVAAVAAGAAVVAGDLLLQSGVDIFTLAFVLVAVSPAVFLARRRLTEAEETALWRERMGFLDRPPDGGAPDGGAPDGGDA